MYNIKEYLYNSKITKKGLIIRQGISLFSSAGIAETYLLDTEINIIIANELLEKRAKLYRAINPDTLMVQGDISSEETFNKVLHHSEKVEFLIATPPCQGVSVAGKNRTLHAMLNDERNFLIYKVIEFVNKKTPNFVLIENVPMFLKLLLPYKDKLLNIQDILHYEFNSQYTIEIDVLDSADYGTPQRRKRAIIKMHKKGLRWCWPSRQKLITTFDAIGHLPSLESGQSSDIPWHFARKHLDKHVLWMKHTPTGQSAFQNKIYFPKKDNGNKIKGYESTYRRIKWDEPAPTITMRNDAISSQRNVHPGRLLDDGTYSDARVLTPLEIMLLTSLPFNWNIPDDTPEILIRQCIGECVPPKLIQNIVSCIGK